ncbi:MAG: NirA family protein [Pseudomonadota bacterium]
MNRPYKQPLFTQEQINSLMSAIAKLELQMPGTGAEFEPETVHGVPIEDLCKEELAKYKQHPLDIYDRLKKWTEKNEIATGLDQFLLRHLGFFNVEPASPGYMVRMRIPACQIRGDQMLAIADISEKYGGGYAHVTTRGNIQMREIEPKNVLKMMQAFTDAGLSCQGSGADSARNLTASPTAGFDGNEIINLAPHTRELSDLILNTRELRALPRKFNISFDGGGKISCVSDSNDIAFQAIRVGDGASVEPGIYCRIGLGGISGHRDLTRPTGMVCKPDQAVMVGYAMLWVFVEHGDRTNRKKARLKYLLDREGIDWFIERTQEKLAELEAGFQLTSLSEEHDEPRPPVDRQGHIGFHPQKDENLSYAGIALEMGRLSPSQMRTIGNLAIKHGDNDVRFTVWQNVLIPHVDNASKDIVAETLRAEGMEVEATAFAAGAVACTGKAACKLALAYTKETGTALVRHLEKKFTLDRPINIHLTGCPNSCAQHYIGDIGLLGATLPGGGDGYHVVIGGGSDQDKGVARPLCGPVASEEINGTIETVVENYLARRDGQQSFLEFVRTVPDEELTSLLTGQNIAA